MSGQVKEVSIQYQVGCHSCDSEDFVESRMCPQGYKQTELGVIPEDWNIKSLGSIGKFKNGINKDGGSFGHGSPLVNLMDVFGKTAIGSIESLGLIDSNEMDKKEYDLKEGDVLFIRSSVKPSGVGLTAVVKNDLENAVYSGFLIKFRSNSELSTAFKEYCFYGSSFRKRTIAASSVSANTNINQDNLKQLLLAYPQSKKEQTAIAKALSDVDALITSLEKLITKKRAIKTAAMQQLLTGKKRLPPFDLIHTGYKQTELGEIPEDWEVRSIGEFAPLQRGFDLPNRDRVNGIYPVVYSNGIVNFHNQFQVQGPGVVTGRSGTIGKVHYIEEDYWPHNTALWVTKFNNAEPKFVYYLYLKIGFSRFSSGSGVPTLNRNDAHSYKLAVPSSKKEQYAIANVLSDMDKEIDALEQRLNKTQQLKQGMMQELLTGRTRLI